ncbi:hypothetical protein Trebr_1598 [Treponema brennaborense DSM 12168]|uniref:Flagellar protein n=1 Tax=Treponema brennaborense (strain DSM 12168 / CIP 105900 / DD5/3) TaxID=906968 RepID=F4LPM5_TREBD|nr:hypothetical protein Trebr_1598 [Treponema brennaborense DSM 12168]
MVLCAALCSAALCFAQTPAAQSVPAQTGVVLPVENGGTGSAADETSVPRSEAESLLVITPAAPDTGAAAVKQPSTVWLFVRMILVLAAVIACIYGIVFLLKKGMTPAQKTDPYLKKVASLTLAPGKFAYVVTLNSHAYLIGVTDSAVNLIGEIDDKELVDAMNLHAESEPAGAKPKDFASVLDLFRTPKNAAASGGKIRTDTASSAEKPFADSAGQASRILRQQRERLQHTTDSFPEDAE